MFIIQINKSDPRVLASERLYAFAKNIYKMHVVWSMDWNGLNKMAQFHVGDTPFNVDMTNLDEVCIPWELFASECAVGKHLTVSFRGTWKEHVVIPTPTIDLGIIHESDIKSAEDYTPPAPPTPDVYQQLKDEIATKADDASFDPETRSFKLWADKQVIAEFEIPGGSTVIDPGDGTTVVQGPKGDKGDDGFSPTITIAPITRGHRVTVTDANGEQSFDVMDGVDGSGESADVYTKSEIDEKLEKIEGATDGESAYDIAVRVDGFVGTEKEWVASLKGEKGDQGQQGVQGIQGQQGVQGLQGNPGEKGEKGDPGEPFTFSKVYSSIDDMNDDFNNTDIGEGQFVLISTGDVEDEDNAKVFYKGTTKYEFLTDLSGAQGIQGPPGEKGETGAKGDQGPQGVQGIQGIQGIQGLPGENGMTADEINELVDAKIGDISSILDAINGEVV